MYETQFPQRSESSSISIQTDITLVLLSIVFRTISYFMGKFIVSGIYG